MINTNSLTALFKNVAIMFVVAFFGIGTVYASPLACTFDSVEELGL
jgi:hypothetical protein